MNLLTLGWCERFAQPFEPYRAEGLVPARVSAEHRGAVRLLFEDGERDGVAAGRLRHRAASRVDLPAVGDWVAARAPEGDGPAVIEAILPRASAFVRRAAGNATGEQVVAANVDVVFLVSGLDGDFNPRRIERGVALAWESGARPVVVLNKADLCADVAARVAEIEAVAPGVEVRAATTVTGDGLETFNVHLRSGVTGALLGSSGVGKSTIINRLAGREVVRTSAVRADDDRGRHTTTHRELFVLPGGGLIIDTPGFRELGMWGAGTGVAEAFADLGDLGARCRYRDCRHEAEPGCAVRAAVEAGTLPAVRLESYHRLLRELRHVEARVDQRAALEEKRRWRSIHQLARRFRPRT
ncbi:MAG: ribosome small subunit-dependent GTPase A [Acidobacteriota bacterium]